MKGSKHNLCIPHICPFQKSKMETDKPKMHFYRLWTIFSNVLLKVVRGCLSKIKNASLMEYNRSPKQTVEKRYTRCKKKGSVQASYLPRVCSSAGHIQGHLETVLSISTFPPQPQTHEAAYILSASPGVCGDWVRGAAASAREGVEVVEPSSLIDKVIMRTTEMQTNNPAECRPNFSPNFHLLSWH